MDKRVGIIGLGIMGGAMARSLVERGWEVSGFDLDQKRLAELAAIGVRPMADVAATAAAARLVITSLPYPAAARAVAEEIARAGLSPRIVIETSTFALEDKETIRGILSAAGHVPLDCPLSGTGAQAAKRDLVIYASGDSAAIAEAMPLFADFGREAHDVGAFGNGSKMKFVANLLVAIHNVATAEAMLLATSAGLDPAQTLRLAGAGAGGSRMFDMRAPMMASGEYEPATMKISTWMKDMDIIGRFARSLKVPTPTFDMTLPVYEKGMQMGLGPADTAAVHEVLRHMMHQDS